MEVWLHIQGSEHHVESFPSDYAEDAVGHANNLPLGRNSGFCSGGAERNSKAAENVAEMEMESEAMAVEEAMRTCSQNIDESLEEGRLKAVDMFAEAFVE